MTHVPKRPLVLPRRLVNGQLRRVEEDITRFVKRRGVARLRLRAALRWADDLVIRLRARWILLRAKASAPRQRLTSAVRSLRKSLGRSPSSTTKPHPTSDRRPAAPRASSPDVSRAKIGFAGRRDRLESVVLWICVGCIVLGGILLIAFGQEIRDLRRANDQWRTELGILRDRVVKIEKEARATRTLVEERATAAANSQESTTAGLKLTQDEKESIRQLIRVLPSASVGPPKIQEGQPLAGVNMAPVPEALAEQIPKLAGARFSIDPTGAIVISKAGSSRADVVIPYQQ